MDPQQQLKIVCWNANGILNKKTELELFLQDTDVALISETHLTSYINLPKFWNYLIYPANYLSGITRISRHYQTNGSALYWNLCHW